MALSWRAVALAALGIVWAALWPTLGTVLLWAIVVALLCGLDFALAASPHRIGLAREPLGAVRRFELTYSRLRIVNDSGRRWRGVVRDAWPPSAVGLQDGGSTPVTSARHSVNLPDGEATLVQSPLRPTRRGDLTAGPVTVRSYGPLGLTARQITVAVPGRLRVLPEFASRKHLPARLARLQELDGRAAVQVRGEGTEFDSLRNYVEGDDVRSIDWRASARASDIVVRTWRPERDRSVLIVVDSGRTAAMRLGSIITSAAGSTNDAGATPVGTAGEPRLDAEIEAALLLAVLADRAGDRVQVIAYDRQPRAFVARASGAALLPRLADALAGVEPQLVETSWPGLAAYARRLVPHRALVVVLTALEPAIVESQILPVIASLSANHQVLIAAVTDPDASELANLRGGETIYDAAAASRMALAREAAARRLRERGVTVLTAPASDLAPAVADEYLRLKASRQL